MAPSHPLPSRKRGETGLLNQIGSHQRRGLAISHPHRGAQRDMSSPPIPKSTVAPPGGQLAGTSQGWGVLMLLVLAAGTSSSPHWHAAEDTMGLLVFLSCAKDTQNMALGCNGQQFPKERVWYALVNGDCKSLLFNALIVHLLVSIIKHLE